MTQWDRRLGEMRAAAGDMPLTDRDERFMRWMAQWDDQAAEALASLLQRARAHAAPPPAEAAMRWALFQAPVSPGLSWVLAALAAHVGPDGIARATMRELEAETLHPETQLVPALAQLSVHGLITRLEANPPSWQLHTDRVRPPSTQPPPRPPRAKRARGTSPERVRNGN